MCPVHRSLIAMSGSSDEAASRSMHRFCNREHILSHPRSRPSPSRASSTTASAHLFFIAKNLLRQ